MKRPTRGVTKLGCPVRARPLQPKPATDVSQRLSHSSIPSGSPGDSQPPVTTGSGHHRRSRLSLNLPARHSIRPLTLPTPLAPESSETGLHAPDARPPSGESGSRATLSPRSGKTPRSAKSPKSGRAPHSSRKHRADVSLIPEPPTGTDTHWATMARLYQQGLEGLLDDQGTDLQQPLPTEVARRWARHLDQKGTTQLSFFLDEIPERLEAMGLTQARAQATLTLRRLVHPVNVPSIHDWDDTLLVQLQLLQERLCPLEPAPMAAWLQEVLDALTRRTADPRSAGQVGLLLSVLAAITRDSGFRSQGWLGGTPEGLSLRRAVADLMMHLHEIVERCPGVDDADRARLQTLAAQVQL